MSNNACDRTDRLAEWQCDLSAHHVEEVSGGRHVAHKPVDLVQLLHLKVTVLRLKERKFAFKVEQNCK